MKRVLVILLLAAGMVLVSPSVALACSCATLTTEDHIDGADTIVVGTLKSITDRGVDRTMIVAVDQVFKGAAGLREKVHTAAAEASCGLGDLGVESEYVFFLNGEHPGRFTASLCGGTAPYGEKIVTELQQQTDGPFEPMPTFVTDTEPTSGPDRIRIVGIGVFVLAAALGGVLVIRRKLTGPRRGTGEVG